MTRYWKSLERVAFLFALVYNDLIVLNCCGLEYDTYYGIMRKEEDGLDIIIADNGNETKEQLTSLKKIEPILNKKNTRINMWTIKADKNIEEKKYKYNEIIEVVNRKGK